MFKKSSLLSATFLAVGLSLAAAAPASAANWQLLGEQTAGHLPDRDVFHIGANAGHFDALRFRVTGNRVVIADVKVIYANGTSEHLNVREHVFPGAHTPAYDLKGTHRRIDRVEVLYETAGFGRRGHVQIYGLKYDGPAPFPQPWPTPAAQWQNLGTHPVSATVDHDTIKVGFGQGTFRALRLQVHDRPIDLYSVRVTFKNGEVQELPVGGTIHAGMTTPVLDLSGNRRVIDRIDLVYRTKWTQHAQARVTVLGLH